jgi:hypothetical protein
MRIRRLAVLVLVLVGFAGAPAASSAGTSWNGQKPAGTSWNGQPDHGTSWNAPPPN